MKINRHKNEVQKKSSKIHKKSGVVLCNNPQVLAQSGYTIYGTKTRVQILLRSNKYPRMLRLHIMRLLRTMDDWY